MQCLSKLCDKDFKVKLELKVRLKGEITMGKMLVELIFYI